MDDFYIVRPTPGWQVILVEDGEEKIAALADTERQAMKYVREFVEETKPRMVKKPAPAKSKK